MKLKFDKKQAANRTKQVAGGALGFFGASYLQPKYASKLGKYNNPDYIDGAKIVAGVSLAASVTRKDDMSAAVQDTGIGVAINGAISLATRKLAKYINKAKGAYGSKPPETAGGLPHYDPKPMVSMNSPAIIEFGVKPNMSAAYGI